jgi:hypothetical protein
MLLLIALIFLLSCKQQERNSGSKSNQKLYFIQTTKHGSDTVFIITPEVPDSTFKNLVTKHLVSPAGEFTVEKFTNIHNAPIDGGLEQFYERSVGVFYKRSPTWPTYSRLYTNNDTLNLKISLMMDYMLSQPELADYPESPIQRIKHFTIPKVQ